ncbi:unnamed protein product [Parnassius apollo]|uniref:(apollo) hypothetical protein n=1 Tax=Parnassius apollo TaxID=110799 RepID=A0A8S3W0E1_PARAO|nr:unnamed protein product [Parnassius apollo]
MTIVRLTPPPVLLKPSTSNLKKNISSNGSEILVKKISNVMRESIDMQRNNVQQQYGDEHGTETLFCSMLTVMDKINDDYLIDARTEIATVIKKYIPIIYHILFLLAEAYSRTSTPTNDNDIAQMLEHFDGM